MKENLKLYVYKQWKSYLKDDRVLFVERSGELFVVARLNTRKYGAEGKPSLKRAYLYYKVVTANRPETGWPTHVQVEVTVKGNGGPNSRVLKNAEMTCG